jgi:hypothetical protein
MTVKYEKLGMAARTKAGRLVLIDESKKAHGVDETVMGVWHMCDGKMTVDEMIDSLAKEAGLDKEKKVKVSSAMKDVLVKLESIGLVKKVS